MAEKTGAFRDQQTIEVDSTSSHSDYGSDSEHSTESLSSSIYEYRYENGRRYHAFQDGLDVVHHVGLLMLDDQLQLAPIGKNPQRILDIGTGTGIWAIDCGERYPSAEVIGIDLSPIQPTWVPPNVQFQIEDAEQPWTWPKDHFDFIHIRHMLGAISDWSALIKQAYKHLKPGGWVEIAEYDLNLHSDDSTLIKNSHLSKYYSLIAKASAKSGRPFDVASDMQPFLEQAGFKNIEDALYKLPLGMWPADKNQKKLGAYCLLLAETGFEAYGMALLTRVLGMSTEKVTELIEGAKKEAKDRNIHSYMKQYMYYGQKPEGPYRY